MANNEFIQLPTPDDYHRVALEVDTEFKNAGGVEQYLRDFNNQQIQRSQAYRNFYQRMQQFGIIIEPVDRSTHTTHSDTFESAQGVLKGGVAGLIFSKKVHSHLMVASKALDHIHVGPPRTETDEDAAKHIVASQLMGKGWEGLARMNKETVEIFEEWEDAAIVAANAHVFRIGLGIVAFGGYALHEFSNEQAMEADLKSFATEVGTVNSGSDWDAALQGLLGDSDTGR